MVGKGPRQATKNYTYEPWRRFLKRGSFEPFEPRLDKVDECTTDDPWTTDVHRIPVRRLLDRYGSSITKGLTESQVHKNRHFYGPNVILHSVSPSKKCWTLFKSLVLGLNSLMWVCLVFSVAVFLIRWISLREKPIENLIFAGVLLFAIVVITITVYYQTFNTQRILMSPGDRVHHALAKRNGRFMEVPSSDLVVGDVVQLSYGDVIPADIRIIESHEFFVDNSGLTGESDPKRRRSVCTDNNPMETKNLAFFSTHALEGYAKGVVVNVGANTVMGKVAEVADKIQVKSESPVQKELDGLVKLLLAQAFIFGIFYFFASLYMTKSWEDALIHVVTVIVANVPEGLTLTSTVLLALLCKKIRSFNCVVKNMHAVETLGATTCICIDKTGTITQNRMAISHLWYDGLAILEADTSEFLDGNQTFTTDDPGFLALARVARLCSRARFKPHQMDKPIFRREVQGDASEAAILRFMETHLGSVTKYRRKYKKIYEMPFNSRTKMQAFVYEIPSSAGNSKQHYLTVKGAPEKLFEFATSILIKDAAFTLDEKWQAKFHKVLAQLGSVGDRVIGFADALLPKDKFNDDYNYDTDKPEFLKGGLRFVGLMSMIDPPRAVVPEAVVKCKKFGLKLIMVTGDHPITATAIAHATGLLPPRSSGLPTSKKRISPSPLSFTLSQQQQTVITMEPADNTRLPESKVFSGKDLLTIESHQLDRILEQPGDMIFARTTPEQKFMIVESLQRLGHKVCVVGDGVNDSPAIKRADVGVVMGISGSEVSKKIGDMVLLDDNFATVVQGVEEARLGFDNLGRLLRYTMADNVASMYCAGVSILFTLPRPFASMAMLLTLLGTDVMAAISLCYEKLEQGTPLQGSPHPKTKRKLITSHLISHIYSQVAVIETAAGFFAYFATMASYGWTPSRLISVNKRQWESQTVNDLMDDLYGQEWSWAARKKLESHCHAAFFIAIVIVQVANVLICTGHRANIFQRLLSNWRVSAAICGELLIAAAILYVPQISFITGLSPLAPKEWLYAVPFAVLIVACDELRRYLLRRKFLVDPNLLRVILH